MNNQQFRRLLLSDNGDKARPTAAAAAAATTPTSVLGARKHSSIPMTPRQAGRGSVQTDFARQLAERNTKANKPKAATSRNTVPKGTKLAAGYIDRTKLRADDDDSETAKRIKNLEESMKLGQIDRETFERLVQDITGGDISTTHLVKGLDRNLLDRIRRGEDVLNGEPSGGTAPGLQRDVEDAFDELADREVEVIVHSKEEKKGQKVVSPPPPVAGVKRSRNDILKELKRQREEAAAAAAAEHEKKYPSLGPGFRKVGAQGETTRIEIDDKGREVLIITGPDGKEKRKVRKQKPEQQPEPHARHDLDDTSKPINMHNLPHVPQDDSADDDIFEGVGSHYDPLANLEDDADDSDNDEDSESAPAKGGISTTADAPRSENSHAISERRDQTEAPFDAPAKRDYFKSVSRTAADASSHVSSADATVRAALAKVRTLDENSNLLQNLSAGDPDLGETQEARLKRRAAELTASDRDWEDMDLGFGASRYDDAEDMEREGEKVKFSQWKGLGANEEDEDGDGITRDAKKQRKRGPKKKRGDKNKAEDVLRVMETQREKRTLG